MGTKKVLLLVFTFASVMAEEKPVYNAAELISQIFPLYQREGFNINFKDNGIAIPKISPHTSEESGDIISENAEYRNRAHRKRRRRPVQEYPSGYPPGYSNVPPGFGGHFYERPSFASEAFSRVTEALTSIALYDDYQCVPRLLCEAGGETLGATGLPSGLQPLLTLLSAYGGISSNPLFVFGRAVLLGMASKGNPGSCRYAYPQCPTDPEQLVYYLNNRNGGFFRFFNSPHNDQQNVQQFYNHLQDYQYGSGYYNQQNYGFQNGGGYGFQRPNSNLNYQNNYGSAYPYNFKSDLSKIQKRIQNKPIGTENDDYVNNINTKWSFPENINENYDLNHNKDDVRGGKGLRFPENNYIAVNNYDEQENIRDTKDFVFPNNGNYYSNHVEEANRYYNKINNGYVNNYKINNINRYKDDDNGYVTVYVVRGNGDPNRPEIVKLRPGQSL